MTKIIVTGVNGFVGHHVAHGLHDRNIEIIGAGNQPALEQDLEGVVDEYYGLDLINPEEVASLNLADVNAIINLAGFAAVGSSKGQGELYNKVNVGVHTVLYEECLRQGVSPRIIAVSTGAVYDPNQPMPITEDSRVIRDEKTNEYVISKKLTEKAVLEFWERGLKPIIARPFNHTGPGQLPGFLLPDLGAQIKQSLTTGKPMMVGNLSTKRDFTDVRDVARAYIELAICPEANLKDKVYNICSGRSVEGSEILRILAEAYGATNLQTKIDPNKLRANEVMDIFGSFERLNQATGWTPTIPIQKTITDFVLWQKSN